MGPTRICAVICETATEAALASLHRAAARADLAEIRADYIRDLDVSRLLAARPLPVLFTCRPARHGGEFRGTETDRLTILRAAAGELRVPYLDLPVGAARAHGPPGARLLVRLFESGQSRLDVPGAPENLELAREPPILRAGVDRVVSRHVIDVPTPDHAHGGYFIISSGGMMPHRLAADGSLGHTFGFCGWSRCHGRGSK